VYLADETGSPTEAVRAGFLLSPRTASRWVNAARKRRFLDPYQEQEV